MEETKEQEILMLKNEIIALRKEIMELEQELDYLSGATKNKLKRRFDDDE